jgi:uncharacterized protein
MRKILSIVFLLAILSSSAPAEENEKPRTITATGESIVYVVPDEVVVSFGVETYDPSLDKAKSDNDRMSESLLKAIKSLKIDEKHIQTDTLNISVQPRNYQKPSEGIDGYWARRSYAITLKDTKLFEQLVDSALKSGANRIYGFDFRTTELRKHRDEARKMAIEAAREKAVALAAELDCKLGKPRTIDEEAAAMYYRGNWGGNAIANAQVQAQAPGVDESGQVMPLGQIPVRANVRVVFDLVPQ